MYFEIQHELGLVLPVIKLRISVNRTSSNPSLETSQI